MTLLAEIPGLRHARRRVDRRAWGPLHVTVAGARSGTVSARELAEDALAEARTRPELGTISPRVSARALDEARHLDEASARREPLGALHGAPLVACAELARDPHDGDAVVLDRLRAAGAVVMPIPTGNRRGAPGLAVHAGVAPGALGSGLGEAVVPEGFPPVVGLRPGARRLPTHGVTGRGWSLRTISPIAVTLADAALLLEHLSPALAGIRTRALGFTDAPRVGIVAPDEHPAPNPELAERLRGAEVSVSSAQLHPEPVADAAAVAEIVEAYERDPSGSVPDAEYLAARWAAGLLRERLLGSFGNCDLLVQATVRARARSVLEPWELAGLPATILPTGGDALVHAVARPGRELDLVRLVGVLG